MSTTFEVYPTIKWKVTIPSLGISIYSPRILQGESEYYLRCYSGSFIYLDFKCGRAVIDRPVLPSSVTVQVQSCNASGMLPSLTNTTKNPTEGNELWRRSFSDVKQADPDFNYKHLTFEVTFYVNLPKDRTGEKSVLTSFRVNPIPCYESLSEDWVKLLDSDSNPDVEFKCEDQSMKVHGLVLRARSPVLANMLQSQMLEGRTGVVKIEDMDFEALKLFLRYLYTGRLEEEPNLGVAMALYEAADKYQVKGLFRRCAQSLIEQLEVENACNVLVVADAHGDDELVEKAFTFVFENNMAISDDGPWTAFRDDHPKLANRFYHRFFKMICK